MFVAQPAVVTTVDSAVTVNGAPQAPEPDGSIAAFPTDTISFRFEASGDPAPSVVWQRDGVTLANLRGSVSIATTQGTQSTTSTLTLFDVGAGDDGNYRATAENPTGTTSSDVDLIVRRKKFRVPDKTLSEVFYI